MNKTYALKIFSVSLLILLIQNLSFAELQHVSLKVGTLAPKGTAPAFAFQILEDYLHYAAKRINVDCKIFGYYGGVMGNDPEMIQRANLGQLDLITPTFIGLPIIVKEIEAFYMAYVIENYGQFDYVMTKNAKYINNMFFKNGWVSLLLLITEGEHNLYMNKPYNTLDMMRKNFKAANASGGPDDTFFGALKISQTPVNATEAYVAGKAGIIHGGIMPSLFAIGMQLYTLFPYFIEKPIRISPTALVMTKKKWRTLPWDMKVFLIVMQPLAYYIGTCILRDASKAYLEAMVQYGCKKIKFAPEELKLIKDQVIAYRESYLGNDEIKREVYQMVEESVREYKTGNSIEKAIYEKDPNYSNFPDKIQKIVRAAKIYYRDGNKRPLLDLTREQVIEKWRLYDPIVACEHYIKTGDIKPLEKWARSFYVTEIVDEIFADHIDSVNRLYGTKQGLRQTIDEMIFIFNNTLKSYKGYQLNRFPVKE